MKKIIVVLVTFCSISAIAQEKLHIEIDNPEPRVGQKITFSIDVDFMANYFKKELGKEIDFTRSTSVFGMQSDDFERVIIFKKAKKYRIGPFDFDFNGKNYTTHTIEVNVLPELPMEIGLWLRFTEFDGQKYLILEQLISNKPDKTGNESGGYSYTIGGVKPEGIEFAELNEDLTEGITLSNYQSSSNTVIPKAGNPADVGFSYSIKKYKIKFDENYSGEYLITEKDIQNIPEIFDIGTIELKK